VTNEVLIFIALVFIGLIIMDSLTYKDKILDQLYIGMPVDTIVNGIISHGYITAFTNKTVSIVLFDYPHELIERKITEIIF